jgi:hypothetical protein
MAVAALHVDGQVYRIVYQLKGIDQPNPSNFLSILVWNDFVSDEPPTWHGSMRRVCEQYGNLYPWMTNSGPKLDLADYARIADADARKDIIDVLSLSSANAHYMPVTRDLSESRRKALLRWLKEVGADGRPLLGTPPATAAQAMPSTPLAAPAAQADLGSKTFAGEQVRRVRYKRLKG